MGPRAYVDLLDRKRIGFPSVACECQFRSPLKFGDMVYAEMVAKEIGEKSITFGYCLYRMEEDGTKVLAAEGSNTCAVVDLNKFKAIPIPKELLSYLCPIEITI